jgi:hypothetical protein
MPVFGQWQTYRQTETIIGSYLSTSQIELVIGIVSEKVATLNNFFSLSPQNHNSRTNEQMCRGLGTLLLGILHLLQYCVGYHWWGEPNEPPLPRRKFEPSFQRNPLHWGVDLPPGVYTPLESFWSSSARPPKETNNSMSTPPMTWDNISPMIVNPCLYESYAFQKCESHATSNIHTLPAGIVVTPDQKEWDCYRFLGKRRSPKQSCP